MRDSITSTTIAADVQVWLLDDDRRALEYFAHILQTHQISCRTFDDPEKLLSTSGPNPGCILVDFRLGARDGLEVAAECRRRWPCCSIILISGHATVPVAVAAMRQELDGVLEKPIDEDALIHEVRSGFELCHSRRIACDAQCDARVNIQQLSQFELEILRLVTDGVPNKQIASNLSLSLRTVEKHRNSLFRKLGVTSAAEATRIWVLANLERCPHDHRRDFPTPESGVN